MKKKSSALLQLIALTSPGGSHDQLFLSNYATINIVDGLKRIPGVGDVALPTPWDYSMRIWITPERLTNYGLTPSDVVNALKGQNIQAAIGRIGAQLALPDQQFQRRSRPRDGSRRSRNSRASSSRPCRTVRSCACATWRGSSSARAPRSRSDGRTAPRPP